MKKVVVGLVSLIIGFASIGSAVADEPAVAKLHMKITSKINDKIYALCLSDTCYPLVAKGKLVSIEASKVSSVIVTNMTNMVMYTQKLPASCQVTIDRNQTLVVSGQLVAKGGSVYLDKMHCAVN
jgi:hypothetical protein